MLETPASASMGFMSQIRTFPTPPHRHRPLWLKSTVTIREIGFLRAEFVPTIFVGKNERVGEY
jgi:hypothetical protein